MASSSLRRKVGLTASLVTLLPSAAIAGSPPGIIVTGSAATIPTLSQNLMIALGVMLAVVGLRFLQQNGTKQKLLSILLLGGGLVMGGLGVDKSMATDAGFSDGNAACDGGSQSQAFRNPFGGGTLFNGCSTTDLKVVSYTGMPCSSAEQIKVNADVGDTIRSGDSATMNSCPAPD